MLRPLEPCLLTGSFNKKWTRLCVCVCVSHCLRVPYPVCSGSASLLVGPCPLVAPCEPAAQPGSGSRPLWPSAAVSPSASPSVCPTPAPAPSPSPPPFLAPSHALAPAPPRAPSLSLVRALAVSLSGGDHSPSAACGGGWQVGTHTRAHTTHTDRGRRWEMQHPTWGRY